MTDHISHEGADSQAEWGYQNKRPFIAQGCDQQGQHVPTIWHKTHAQQVVEADSDEDQGQDALPMLIRWASDCATRALAFVAFTFIVWNAGLMVGEWLHEVLA